MVRTSLALTIIYGVCGAVTVVPCYQSFYIAIPILGGIVAYYDSINVIQLLGIALLLSGVIRLSIFIGKGEMSPESIAHIPMAEK